MHKKRTKSSDLVVHINAGEDGIKAAEQLLSERIASYKRKKIGDRTIDDRTLEKTPKKTRAKLEKHMELYEEVIEIARYADTHVPGILVLFTGAKNFKFAKELCELSSEYVNICDTEGGAFLEELDIFEADVPIPADVGVQAFDEFSERMCKDYKGSVVALCKRAGPARCLTAVELRTLLDNPYVNKINDVNKKEFVETFIAHEYLDSNEVRTKTKEALRLHFADLDIEKRAVELIEIPLTKEETKQLYGITILEKARLKTTQKP
ncbi:MAG: hypothetical protein KAJ75_04285 [Alphaproteobacteria bacterium]|nr:hypothetical protein [Alphaproteobacteria bacterium]